MWERKISGFTLLEVCISLFLISLILFGFDSMQLMSLKQIEAKEYLHIAIHQISNMSERLSLLKTQEELDLQIQAWNKENQVVLPHGIGTVEGAFPIYTIRIFWGKKSDHCEKMKVGESGCFKQDIHVA